MIREVNSVATLPTDHPLSPYYKALAERIRQVRTRAEGPPALIGITSSVGGEGVTTVAMGAAETRFLKVVSDRTASWIGEVEQITENSGTFGAFNLTARPLAAMTLVSEDLLADAENVGSILEDQDLA